MKSFEVQDVEVQEARITLWVPREEELPDATRSEEIPRPKIGPLAKALYFLATVQIAWYYQGHVPSYMYLYRYENGTDRMPFQGRLLMMFLLRWAHSSTAWIALATATKKLYPWVLPQITPELLLLILLNTVCIVGTGAIAVRIYEASSRQRLLTLWIYPLVLTMCVSAYILHTTQNLSYYYDFPSLLFFSAGIYLIYFRCHPALFAAVFLVGTINRETTLVLLLFFVLARVAADDHIDWRLSLQPQTWGVVVPLAMAWLAWHAWIGWVFRANPTELACRIPVNVGLVLLPLSWPQLFGAGCYMFPVIFIFRGSIQDPTFRIWLWTLPVWIGLMFFYGILIETRIFGELIVYLACLTALIAERAIVTRLRNECCEVRMLQHHDFSTDV